MDDYSPKAAVVLYGLALAVAAVAVMPHDTTLWGIAVPWWIAVPAGAVSVGWTVARLGDWISFLILTSTLLSPVLLLRGDPWVLGGSGLVLLLLGRREGWAAAVTTPGSFLASALVQLVRQRTAASVVLVLASLPSLLFASPPSPWSLVALAVPLFSGFGSSVSVPSSLVPVLFGAPHGALASLAVVRSSSLARGVALLILPAVVCAIHGCPLLPATEPGAAGGHTPLQEAIRSKKNELPGQEGSQARDANGGNGPRTQQSRTPGPPPTLFSLPVRPIQDYDPCAELEKGSFQGLPVRTVLRRLRQGVPVRVGAPRLGGRSVKFRMRLEDGMRVLFKPDHHAMPVASARGEVGAFVLARMLGMDEVPPAVLRSFDRDMLRGVLVKVHHPKLRLFDERVIGDGHGRVLGALIAWVRGARDLVVPDVERAILSDPRSFRARQLMDLVLLDYVAANFDRMSGGNLLEDRQGRIYFIDNGAAFPWLQSGTPWLRRLRLRVRWVRREVLRRLISLEHEDFVSCLAQVVGRGRAEAAWGRLEEARARLVERIRAHGPSLVVF